MATKQVIIKDMYSISEYEDMKSKLEREIADYKREVSAMRGNIEYIRWQNNVYERLLFDDNKQEIDWICN